MRRGSIRSHILLAALVPLVLAVVSVGAFLLTRHALEIERNLVERTVSLARQAAMLAELPHAALKAFLDDALARPARGRNMRRELQSFADAYSVPI